VTSDLRTAHRRLRHTGRFPPLRELRWLVLRCPYSGRRVWRVEAWSKAA
jgi:hypothetical protein